jgi:hypothetical protein
MLLCVSVQKDRRPSFATAGMVGALTASMISRPIRSIAKDRRAVAKPLAQGFGWAEPAIESSARPQSMDGRGVASQPLRRIDCTSEDGESRRGLRALHEVPELRKSARE